MSGGPLPPSVAPIVEDLKRIFLACLAVIAVLVAAIVVTAVFTTAMFPPADLDGAERAQPSKMATWLSLLGFQLFTVVFLVLLISHRLPGRVTFTLALGPPHLGFGEIVRMFVFSAAVLSLLSLLSFTFFREDVLKDLALFRNIMADVPLWLPALVLIVGAPISEELLFRGLLLGQLRRTRMGFVAGAVLATAGWTLLHLSYTVVGLLDVFLAGLMFSWTLWRTGTIWVPIGFHAIYNAIVLALISTPIVLPA